MRVQFGTWNRAGRENDPDWLREQGINVGKKEGIKESEPTRFERAQTDNWKHHDFTSYGTG